MSKRTSEDLSNAIEVPDPNNLDAVDDEEEVFDGSELDSAADVTPAIGVPSHIDVSYYDSDEESDEERVDVTSEVIAHLHSLQK
ncbi:hypothetical protein TrST_g13675 [Triparma strigata]|uniref:Uncharacterized protein n=1 Tax=Triparma strigata TaxID=1606541 RepID=A0A9W7BTL8_9STRA|nr:hypothetical protein TrST_g13675 [Triparma strigata]